MRHVRNYFILTSLLAISPSGFGESDNGSDRHAKIINSDFESGNLSGWNSWRTKRTKITTQSFEGKHAAVFGPEMGYLAQIVSVKPNSRYRLSAYVKTESGSEEVQLIASDYGGAPISVSSALTDYKQLSLEFTSAYAADSMMIKLLHLAGAGKGYVDRIELIYLGEAPPPVTQEFIKLGHRTIMTEGGEDQQPDEIMEWFLDDKFGMFIHWGVYAAMDESNEWAMHNIPMDPTTYRGRAEDPVDGFTASKFDPAQWAQLAKTSGMKYMVLTARHHDGYALFDSQHPNSWTSVKHLNRDLIKEYVGAVREAGLRVGLYYSPMSWRYPGYYDVYGNDCKPNVWNYTAASWHKENARQMKEEVYEQVRTLLSQYGPIEYMFWDGAWIAQSINDKLEDIFWDTGKYQNPENEWPVSEKYIEKDAESDMPLGIMGLVRKHQPDLIVNERFSWVGDVHAEEGASATSGAIRTEQVKEKCISVIEGGWGYAPRFKPYSYDQMAMHLSSCVVRNVNMLLNVAPDRHGTIPENQQAVLRQMGQWLDKVGDAVYNTRGGPWQPLFGEYGFTYQVNKIYCHVYAGYRELGAGSFRTQSIGSKQVSKVTNLYNGAELSWKKHEDNTLTIHGVDYTLNPAVTILEITLSENIY